MDNAARTRQRVLAIFLPVTAVLYISAEALSPKGTDQVISTTATALKVLPIARATGSPAPCARKSSWCPRPGITRSRSGPTSPPAQSCASWNRSRAVPRAGHRAAVLPGRGATAWGYCP